MKFLHNYLEKLFLVSSGTESGSLDQYIENIKNGAFENKLVYGISDKIGDFLVRNPQKDAGAFYLGYMGSGKSIAMKFTAITNKLSNNHNTIMILFDSKKGLNDYSILYKGDYKEKFSKNTITAIDDSRKIIPIIDYLYKEILHRQKSFSLLSASNLSEYNRKMKALFDFRNGLVSKQEFEDLMGGDDTLPELPDDELKVFFEEKYKAAFDDFGLNEYKETASILLIFEEFWSVPSSNEVKFQNKYDVPGSIAYKMNEFARIGRSYGLTMLAASQKATGDDLPMSLRPAFKHFMGFYTKSHGDLGTYDIEHGSQITVDQNGLCAYEEGFIQFPYFGDTDKTIKTLFDSYLKEFNARLLSTSVEKFKTIVESGDKGIIKEGEILDIINNHDQFDFNDIAKRFLSEFLYDTEEVENKTFKINFIAKNGEFRAGVFCPEKSSMGHGRSSYEMDDKALISMIDGAKHLELENIIVFSPESRHSTNVDRAMKNSGLTYTFIDLSDLKQMGTFLSESIKLREDGSYENFKNKLPLVTNEK